MDKLNKIEKRLTELAQLQKQLEKKRKKLMKSASKARKASAARTRKLAASKLPLDPSCIANKKRSSFLRLFALSLGLSLLATAVAVGVSQMVKRAKVQHQATAQNGYDELADVQSMTANTDYEKASLEELEDALLKVENQLDEVTSAIEKSKKN